jgi:predicted DNA-binding transcriptional regulator AlpA
MTHEPTMEPVLGNDEAARLCGFSPKTLPKLRLSGRGPRYLKLGRKVAYRRQDIEQWLREHVRTSTSDIR